MIVGSGPAGLSAALTCIELGFSYVVLEKEREFSWTIRNYYHKGKEVMAEPNDVNLEATLPHWDSSREELLAAWSELVQQHRVDIRYQQSVIDVKKASEVFTVHIGDPKGQPAGQITCGRVVIAIGLRGAPNKLRLPNEDLKFRINGNEESKVLYSLTNPADYRGRRIVVVGGGNVAVEAAVDLVSTRSGAEISPRSPKEMNDVTLLVRDFLAPTVKFGNKFQLYQCADDGILNLRFGLAIKEMRENELVLQDVQTGRDLETIPNDYVFALIGGERPDRFLQSIGITIT